MKKLSLAIFGILERQQFHSNNKLIYEEKLTH